MKNDTKNGARNDLKSIEGDELSAVCFVRDYIELHFDGPILRLLGDVSIRNGEALKARKTEGFKDWLCRNIGRRVALLGPLDGNKIEIKFHGNDLIKVEGNAPGLEFAHFVSYPDKKMQVWEME